jgi:gamma-glutamyltranspeptidase/glutathione hydrolase
MTLSNGEGCGHVIPGTGIMLNNMLGEEDVNPHGFDRWPTDTRMSSMMAPSLVETSRGDRYALGSGGSNRIRSAVLQVISHLLDLGDDPMTAVSRPRVHVEADRVSVEGPVPADVAAAFADAELWPERSLFFGGVHIAARRQGHYAAAGDPRRGGIGTVLD